MLEKLNTGKFQKDLATAEEVKGFVQKANEMVVKYHWQKRTVSPWGRPEKIPRMLDYISDFPQSTFSTKQLLISLANGLADVLNNWERVELKSGLAIKFLSNGEVVSVPREYAELYISLGIAERAVIK